VSHDVTPAAYRTRLGNSTAKSVLALLADEANSDGYGWPGVERIAAHTEVELRTVRRVVQVFGQIGLITKVSRGKKHSFGIQLNMDILGTDLHIEFGRAYCEAQGKRCDKCSRRAFCDADGQCGKCRSDTAQSVAATPETVAATAKSVVATLPPHPLIGGPAIDPLMTQLPLTPSHGEGEEALKENANSRGPKSGDSGTKGLGTRVVRIDTTPIDLAVDQVMQGCGFTARRLRSALRAVIQQEADKGVAAPTTALAMIAAWKKYILQDSKLRVKWGARRFFEEGYWRDARSWPWDGQALRDEQRQAEARVGTSWN
jgi:hypothetical protein